MIMRVTGAHTVTPMQSPPKRRQTTLTASKIKPNIKTAALPTQCCWSFLNKTSVTDDLEVGQIPPSLVL